MDKLKLHRNGRLRAVHLRQDGRPACGAPDSALMVGDGDAGSALVTCSRCVKMLENDRPRRPVAPIFDDEEIVALYDSLRGVSYAAFGIDHNPRIWDRTLRRVQDHLFGKTILGRTFS